MLTSPRARKLAIAAATLGLTAGLVPHAMAFPLLGDILPGAHTDCSATGNSGEIAPSESLNGLGILNAFNGNTNNNCSVLGGASILSGNSLFSNGLFGGPLLGDINILSGGDGGSAGDGGNAGNGGGGVLVAPLTGIGINQCTTVSVLLGLGSDAGCANGLGIINMFNGFGGF